MMGLRLMRVIEGHSEELALGLTAKLRASERTRDFRKLPAEELQRAAADFYRNLGEWLLKKSEADIEARCRAIGARRAAEGVHLHQFIWALIISRNFLWHFLQTQALADTVVALYGEMELRQVLIQFYDRAAYYGVLGYEGASDQESPVKASSEKRQWV